MARNYEDLSRRALMALNKDYDNDNDGKLMSYFAEVDPERQYEGIRPIESVVDRIDQITDTVKENGGALKEAAIKAAEGTLDKVINTLGDIISGVTEGGE